MGTEKANPRKKGVSERMMINFSYYELDDLLEIREALDEAIKKKQSEDMNLAYQQEDMQLEEQLEEFRDQ
jgi:isocitrate/isopropylmalate dehydrogenase